MGDWGVWIAGLGGGNGGLLLMVSIVVLRGGERGTLGFNIWRGTRADAERTQNGSSSATLFFRELLKNALVEGRFGGISIL